MHRWMAALLMLGLTTTAAMYAQQPDVEYVTGTVKGLSDGATGTVDMSSPQTLEFRAGSGQFSIPYEEITSVKCREENRFRLGVLATIAVGMLKARSKRHFVTIEWKHADDLPAVVTLDAPRQKARGMAAVLRARAPHACASGPGQSCGFGD
jgi:hypothetical protein